MLYLVHHPYCIKSPKLICNPQSFVDSESIGTPIQPLNLSRLHLQSRCKFRMFIARLADLARTEDLGQQTRPLNSRGIISSEARLKYGLKDASLLSARHEKWTLK